MGYEHNRGKRWLVSFHWDTAKGFFQCPHLLCKGFYYGFLNFKRKRVGVRAERETVQRQGKV